MGVLACDRTGCENVMCDYSHPEYGYLCNDCMVDLQEYFDEGNVDIRSFIYTHRRNRDSNIFKLDAYEIFTRRY